MITAKTYGECAILYRLLSHIERPGKQSVFVANQNDDSDDISPEEKEALIVDNDALSKECKSLNEQISHFNNGEFS